MDQGLLIFKTDSKANESETSSMTDRSLINRSSIQVHFSNSCFNLLTGLKSEAEDGKDFLVGTANCVFKKISNETVQICKPKTSLIF
jgi:hypothetical protein